MKLKVTLLAAAATMAISPAAHAYKGLYGAIGAGLTIIEGDDFSNDGPNGAGPFAFDSSADYDNGVGVYAALGYAWGNNWRTELEFSFRDNDINQIDADGGGFSGLPEGSVSGGVGTRAYMINAIYDFAVDSPLQPYLGLGVGFAQRDPSINGSVTPGAPTSPLAFGLSEQEGSFAYQGIAGVAYELAENLLVDVSYRYFGTTSISNNEVFTSTINGAPGLINLGTNSHNFFAGLRWNFAAPPPPPVQYKDCWDGSSVPVVSECPPQLQETEIVNPDPIQFTVYFDYDKSNLTSQASTLVQEASSRALEFDVDTVVVQGNTDTSGSSAYNQALSQRRASVVRDALIANGVSADAIRIEAFGEGNLAKPTPDGTREPLNRRSDVTISFE